MPWPEWADYRRFADFRLGLRNSEDGEEDIDLG
jgi:hypothetical protein